MNLPEAPVVVDLAPHQRVYADVDAPRGADFIVKALMVTGPEGAVFMLRESTTGRYFWDEPIPVSSEKRAFQHILFRGSSVQFEIVNGAEPGIATVQIEGEEIGK